MSSHVSCRILSDKTDQTRTLLIWLEGFGGLEREGCLERTLEVGPHGPLMVFMWTWKLLWLKFRICLTCTCLVSIVQFYFCHINRAGKSRRLRNSSLLRCSQTYSRKWRLFKKICWDVESICKICLSRLFFFWQTCLIHCLSRLPRPGLTASLVREMLSAQTSLRRISSNGRHIMTYSKI